MSMEDWIPIDGKIPEYKAQVGGQRFVSVLACTDKGMVCEALFREGEWLAFGGVDITRHVVAWMPLPKPYRHKR